MATRDELRTRNNALQEQVESMMATVQRQQDQLAAAQSQLASVFGRGESVDGLVRATANAAGTITNVELTADAFGRSTPEKLGRSITEAVQKAAAGAQEETAALFAPVIAANDELPDLADLVPGAPSGGHTLARHVGRTDADLIARLTQQPSISGSSSFSSRAHAEASVARAIDEHTQAIQDWLSGTRGQLVIEGGQSDGPPVGPRADRGGTNVNDVSRTRVVLRRSSDLGIGYRIHTAFPVT